MKLPRGAATGLGAVSLGLGIVLAAAASSSGQSSAPFAGTLDEHPAIRYEDRPPADRVARLRDAIAAGALSLTPDAATRYLRPVLKALDISEASQLLVFSRTGLQREHTSPTNPRALYFNASVVVGYIPGAPSLEIAAHDPQQGVMFYTLEQQAAAPTLVRRTNCLTCHLSASTLEVPGFIDRSNMVDGAGQVLPQLGHFNVDHRTPHTERWGGWFVTGRATAPPYGPLGHLGNITVETHPTSGPTIFSDQVFIDWMNRQTDARYPGSESDLAALMTFNHQSRGLNLITRLNWEARIAAAESRALTPGSALETRLNELADYLLFAGEPPLTFEVTPRAGFAEAIASWAPTDDRGRSCAQMDLTKRLSRYSCSYLLYSEAFASLPLEVRRAVYRRMLAILDGRVPAPAADRVPANERVATAELLRATLRDLPAD